MLTSIALATAALVLAPATLDAERVLVALEGGGAVLVAADSGQVLDSYATGPNAFGAVFSPDGRRAFVTDKDAGTLVEIDPATSRVLASLEVGAKPQQPAMTADGRAFIPLSGEAAIAVVDTRAPFTVLRKIATGAGSKPHIVSLSPDGMTLWATVQGTDPRIISIGLTATGEEAPRDYRYDLVPRVLAATNAGAFFTAHHSTGLHFASLADGSVSTPYMDCPGTFSEARKQIEGVSVSEDGRLVAITHEGRKALIAVWLDRTNRPIYQRTFRLSAVPYWVTLDPAEEAAYVSLPGSGEVLAYDLYGACTETPLWTARTGGKPKRMAVTEVP